MRLRRTLFSERAAVAFAFRELKLMVQPGGAMALAAPGGQARHRWQDRSIVLSGGNVDPELFARLVA
jgi:threonine dehydratase